MYRSIALAVVAGVFGSTSVAWASESYTVVVLHPSADTESYATGAATNIEVGKGITATSQRALMWRGSASSAVDLTPPGYRGSSTNAIFGAQVGGAASISDGSSHAILWDSVAGTFTDLHPAVYSSTSISGIAANQQVGDGSVAGTAYHPHALLWGGTAGSVIDLHPLGFDWSTATATDGTHQVGFGQTLTPVGRGNQALLWSGSATSAVNLSRPGMSQSQAFGISNGRIVGWAGIDSLAQIHAVIWDDWGTSVVDLNPTVQGYDSSKAAAIAGEWQVGSVFGIATGFQDHAVVWRGSADTIVDLHQFLPPGFNSSAATGVDEAGNIVGWARNASGAQAVLWLTPEPDLTFVVLLAAALTAVCRRHRADLMGAWRSKITA